MLVHIHCMHECRCQGSAVGVVPWVLSTVFLKQALSLAWNSLIRLNWLASEPQRSSCLLHPLNSPPHAGITSTYHSA